MLRALLIALSCGSSARALQLTPRVSTALPETSLAASPSRCHAVTMGRKGRPKMPSPNAGMQGSFAAGAQQQAPSAPTDGVPVFYLYCRTGQGKPWYPVSAMKGDGQSKGLINAWLNSPLAKGVFKDRLDEGMARSIFDSERRLADMACEQYRQLKDSKARLQWGFKYARSLESASRPSSFGPPFAGSSTPI